MLRALALTLTLLLAGQAFASGARAMVCRYTGKIMEDCPCPPAAEKAQFERQSCCEVLQSVPFQPTAVTRSPWELPRIDLVDEPATAWRRETQQVLAEQPALPVAQAPPDGSGRYLRLQQLLL